MNELKIDRTISFATSNSHKFREAAHILRRLGEKHGEKKLELNL